MQTPQQRAEWEAWRRKQPVEEPDLETMIDRIVEKAGITSRGGIFEFPLKDVKDIPPIREYCGRYGWNCTYEPYYVTATFGDYTLKVHLFKLEPR